jgi:hypothetical protein
MISTASPVRTANYAHCIVNASSVTYSNRCQACFPIRSLRMPQGNGCEPPAGAGKALALSQDPPLRVASQWLLGANDPHPEADGGGGMDAGLGPVSHSLSGPHCPEHWRDGQARTGLSGDARQSRR